MAVGNRVDVDVAVREGVAVRDAVGVKDGVRVSVGLGVRDGVRVNVGEGVMLGVRLGVRVKVEVGVLDGDGVMDAVAVLVSVGVWEGVAVFVTVTVLDAVGVRVTLGVMEGVGVLVIVGVNVGVRVIGGGGGVTIPWNTKRTASAPTSSELTADDSSCVWFVSWMYSGLVAVEIVLTCIHPPVRNIKPIGKNQLVDRHVVHAAPVLDRIDRAFCSSMHCRDTDV